LLIGNYHFAHDYGCVHPGMPLGRKHLRRSRDAPTGGIGRTQRTTSRLGFLLPEVKLLDHDSHFEASAPHKLESQIDSCICQCKELNKLP